MTFDGTPRLLTVLTWIATVGTGVAAGVFFAFSSFVMPALSKVSNADGIATMQSINKQAPTPLFMTVLVGTAALCGGLAVWALAHLDSPAARYALAGAVLYLAQILLTGVYHIPRNNALALLDPDLATSATAWRGYLADWTVWNHLRTALCVGSTAAFALGLRLS